MIRRQPAAGAYPKRPGQAAENNALSAWAGTTSERAIPEALRFPLTQEALRVALSAADTDRWLDRLERLPSHDVSHASVVRALDAARDEFGS